MKIALVCLGFALPVALLALDPAKTVFQFNCRNWTREAGLPADKITAVTQAPDGYIWLGSQNGLIRFDGLEFKVVPIGLPQAQGQDIGTLDLAANGTMWFSVIKGGFGSFDGQTFSAISDPRWTAPGMESTTIHAGRDGAIWTGNVYGWGRWMSGQPAQTHYDDKLGPVSVFIEDPSARTWMGTSERGLFYWADGKLERFPDDELKKENIHAIAKEANGDLWIGTGRGLRRYDAENHLKKIYFPTSQATALLLDRQGVLWVGTNELGLARFENDGFSFLRKADGLGGDYVTSLFEDREGSLWIGTLDGLSQLSDLKFPIYSVKEGLAKGDSLAVAASAKGGLWIATAGGASYFDGKTFRNYTEDWLLPNRYVTQVFEARNGDVYLADGDKNINVLAGGRLATRYANASWPEAFAEDTEGVIGGIGPKLVRFHNGEIQPFAFRGAEPDLNWVNLLCVAKDGALWVATNNGLFRIEKGQAERWSTANGLSSDRVHYVLQDVDGSMWVGLPTGMARIKDHRIKNITTEDGLPDGRIYAIVPGDHGHFWVASGHGIFRVSRESLNSFADGKSARVRCEVFDGLESVKVTDRTAQGFSGAKTPDGRIWFPSPRGVVMINPARYFTNRFGPQVHIQKVSADGRNLPGKNSALLNVGTGRVEFFFTALSYIAPKKTHLRYRLQGFDRTWIDADVHRSVVYNNLPAGRYTFTVQAVNADGVANTGDASYGIELPPRFQETVWFYGLCSLGGVTLLVGAYRWKVRHMEKLQKGLQDANDLLERKVGKRTEELARERARFKFIFDSVPVGFTWMRLHQPATRMANPAYTRITGVPTELSQDLERYRQAMHPDDRARRDPLHRRLLAGEINHYELEKRYLHGDGAMRWALVSVYLHRNATGDDAQEISTLVDITERKRSETELAKVHAELLATSRQAGMAEIATGVLHNVGNVLNSVNVSATLVMDRMRQSKVANLPKLTAMLQAHSGDLADFLTNNAKGRAIPAYLLALAEQIAVEQKTMIEELDHLRRNIDHIKDIVAMQQNYAKNSGFIETVPLVDLVEDALRINASSLARHEVEVVRDFQINPVTATDKHKVMQILLNLVRNAKFACDDAGRSEKRITVRIAGDAQWVRVSVSDNGVGIPAENLTRIFNHGFTTRKQGHGFGLHSGALAAKELGGSLSVQSDGPGHGATFILELPYQPDTPGREDPGFRANQP